jgi:hypothetical protein
VSEDKEKSIFDTLTEKLGRYPTHLELMDEMERMEKEFDKIIGKFLFQKDIK